MQFVGIDIGGANIKLASTCGQTKQVPFPIWKDPYHLKPILESLKSKLNDPHALGVTMTAELADCFESKRDGVQFVVAAVEEVFQSSNPMFYQTDGELVPSQQAIEQHEVVSAANWHAIACMLFQSENGMPESGFMVDIGSTTTDIIPVQDGQPVISKQTDLDRLSNSQLVYAGIERTPICSLLSQINLSDRTATIAREFFATTGDAFRVLGELAPEESFFSTADGRPASVEYSKARLARMVCSEVTELGEEAIHAIANQTKNSLMSLITGHLNSVVHSYGELPKRFKVSGGGSWFGAQCIEQLNNDRRQESLGDVNTWEVQPYGPNTISGQCAAALAVAIKRQQVAGVC